MAALSLSCLASVATLLLVSGIAKAISPTVGMSAFAVLPLPSLLGSSVLRRGLPWLEIAVAAVLFFASGVVLWAGTAAAVVLFALFTVFVVTAVRRGDRSSCGCFGALSRAPMSRRTVVRNLVFLAVAAVGFLAVSLGEFHGPVVTVTLPGALAALIPLALVALIVWSERSGVPAYGASRVAVRRAMSGTTTPPSPTPTTTGAAVSASRTSAGTTPDGEETSVAEPAAPGMARALAEQDARASSSTSSPHVAAEAGEDEEYHRERIPLVSVTDARGQRVSLRALAATQARLIVLVREGCGPCAEVVSRLGELGASIGPVAVHPVVRAREEVTGLPTALRDTALVDPEHAVQHTFDLAGTPAAVVLGADGLLAGGPELGREAVLALLEEIVERFG